MEITLDLWVALLIVGISALAGFAGGWAWGYTKGNARYR